MLQTKATSLPSTKAGAAGGARSRISAPSLRASLASFRELALGWRAERRTAKASRALLQAIVVRWMTPGALLHCSVWAVRRSPHAYGASANRFYRSPPNRLPTGRDPFAGPRSPRSYCRESSWRDGAPLWLRRGKTRSSSGISFPACRCSHNVASLKRDRRASGPGGRGPNFVTLKSRQSSIACRRWTPLPKIQRGRSMDPRLRLASRIRPWLLLCRRK